MKHKLNVLAAVALCAGILPATVSASQVCYKQGIYTYCYTDTNGGSGVRGNTEEPPSTDKSFSKNVVELTPNNRGQWLEIIGKMKEAGNTKAVAELQTNFDKVFPK